MDRESMGQLHSLERGGTQQNPFESGASVAMTGISGTLEKGWRVVRFDEEKKEFIVHRDAEVLADWEKRGSGAAKQSTFEREQRIPEIELYSLNDQYGEIKKFPFLEWVKLWNTYARQGEEIQSNNLPQKLRNMLMADISNREATQLVGEYLKDTVPKSQLHDRNRIVRYNADADDARNEEARKIMKGSMLFSTLFKDRAKEKWRSQPGKQKMTGDLAA